MLTFFFTNKSWTMLFVYELKTTFASDEFHKYTIISSRKDNIFSPNRSQQLNSILLLNMLQFTINPQ